MSPSPLDRAKELIEGMKQRRDLRYANGDLGELFGWQTEVNEIQRILEYLIECASDPDSP